MSTTDSDSSSAASIKKRSKSSKKTKRKSHNKHKREKKEKRHKQKKRYTRDSDSGSSNETKSNSQTVLPTRVETADVDCFGPPLPPHLLKSQQKPEPGAVLIGPQIPSCFNVTASDSPLEPSGSAVKQSASSNEDEDDLSGTYGPMPVTTDGNQQTPSTAQLELEERALELKLAAIDGVINKPVDQKVREEWMLELPEVGLKSGLAALSNLKRKFHHGKERPDFTDRSEWTKTPQNEGSTAKVAATTSKTTAKTLMTDAQAIYERQRDEEQERMAKKHKKKHKRDESLVDLHQKKLRKEQKQKEKELAAAGAKPERRPFSRDVDLKLNKIDKNQTKSIVDKAKVLNTKFATGHVKYL